MMFVPPVALIVSIVACIKDELKALAIVSLVLSAIPCLLWLVPIFFLICL